MNEQLAPTTAEDAAWVAFNVPMQVDELRLFCSDVERMFRINPHLEINKWEKIGDKQYQVQGRNTSQQPSFDFDYELSIDDSQTDLRVVYKNSLKQSTSFKVEAAEQGAKLTIIDEYTKLSEEAAKARENEIDRSLEVWAKYLQRFMMTWKRWSWISPWRWYMRRVWQPMKPMSRRITYMLVWITVFEVALIALGVAIYFAEYN